VAEPQEETPAAADPEPLPAAESVDEAEAVEESPVEPAAEREAEAATDESPEEAADGTLELDTSTLDSAANAGSIKEHAGPWSKAGPLIAGLVLILALIGWLLRRRTKAARSTSSQAEATGDKQPFDEPGTVRFATTNTGSAPLLLRLSGVLPGDTTGNRPFTLQVPISGPNWKVELGRELTDLVLASPSVSRRHAGLQLLDGRMTITDFDSTNGTRVNGVSCLAGEVFFVSSGDQLQFGEVLCTLLLSATDNAGDNSGVSEPAKPTPEPGSRPPA
jgi:hypothetical protein